MRQASIPDASYTPRSDFFSFLSGSTGEFDNHLLTAETELEYSKVELVSITVTVHIFLLAFSIHRDRALTKWKTAKLEANAKNRKS